MASIDGRTIRRMHRAWRRERIANVAVMRHALQVLDQVGIEGRDAGGVKTKLKRRIARLEGR